jgi:hypothetical protein
MKRNPRTQSRVLLQKPLHFIGVPCKNHDHIFPHIFHLLNNRVDCLIAVRVAVIDKRIRFVNEQHRTPRTLEIFLNNSCRPADIFANQISTPDLY